MRDIREPDYVAHQACHQRQSVLYRCVPELVAALVRGRDKGTRDRLMRRLAIGIRISPSDHG